MNKLDEFKYNVAGKNKERNGQQAEYRNTRKDSLASGQYRNIKVHNW